MGLFACMQAMNILVHFMYNKFSLIERSTPLADTSTIYGKAIEKYRLRWL